MKLLSWRFAVLMVMFVEGGMFTTTLESIAWAQESFELDLLPGENERNLDFWYEQIEAARLHPISLNSASIDELEQIPGVPKRLAEFLIRYRDQHGPFRSKSEVRQVLHLSDDDWAWFSKFISVKTQHPRMGVWLRSRFSGKNSRPFQGEKLHSYQRFQFAADLPFSGGVLLEKDPLEARWTDHAAGYVRAKIGRSVSLFIGDFFPAFGQGILLSLPYSLGKSVSPAEILKIHPGRVRGDVSAIEDHFFRGLAGSVTLKILTLYAFRARNAWDGRIDSLSGIGTLEAPVVHVGSHLNQKNRIHETVTGVHLESGWRKLSAGVTVLHSAFSCPVVGLKNDVPFGSLRYLGGDFRASYRILQIAGEWAHLAGRGRSFLVGGILETRPMTWVVAVRNYGEQFWNPHGFVFGEQGIPQNEKGWYAGFVLKPRSRTQIRSFLDLFLVPQINRAVTPSPSGKEWGFRWQALAGKVGIGSPDLFCNFL
ncbi:MAG: helix-hairpin-helix domain-containing protein [Calditrichaeota bacterium]|nr:helix-hairpin-helix domain-containing protein [Calditrichota bacterium]